MRETAAICAILGGVIEAIATYGGPGLASAGLLPADAPLMPGWVAVFGMATAAIAIVGGVLAGMGRWPRASGAAILVATLAGIVIVGPWTGFYTMGAVLTLLGGVLALFIGARRPRLGRR